MEYGDCITTDRKIGRVYMNFNLSFLNKLKFVEYLFNRKISIKTLINRRRRV